MTTVQKTASTTKTKKPPAETRAGKISVKTTHVTADIAKDDLAGIEAETIDVAAYTEMDAQARAAQIKSLNDAITDKEVTIHKASRQSAILYFRLGVILKKEKDSGGHGDWLDWLVDHDIPERRAQRAMQIAKHFKQEEAVSGLTLTEALNRSKKKPESETVSKRRRIITGLESIKDRIHGFVQDLAVIDVSREPILRYIDQLEAELQTMRHHCSAQPVAQ